MSLAGLALTHERNRNGTAEEEIDSDGFSTQQSSGEIPTIVIVRPSTERENQNGIDQSPEGRTNNEPSKEKKRWKGKGLLS